MNNVAMNIDGMIDDIEIDRQRMKGIALAIPKLEGEQQQLMAAVVKLKLEVANEIERMLGRKLTDESIILVSNGVAYKLSRPTEGVDLFRLEKQDE